MRQLLLEEVRKVNAIFWFLILEEDDFCTTCPKWPCPSEEIRGEDTHASRRTRAHPARYRHHVSVSIPCCILQKRVWHAVSLDSFLSIDRAHVVTTESQSSTPRPNILCVLKAVWQRYRLDGTRFFQVVRILCCQNARSPVFTCICQFPLQKGDVFALLVVCHHSTRTLHDLHTATVVSNGACARANL